MPRGGGLASRRTAAGKKSMVRSMRKSTSYGGRTSSGFKSSMSIKGKKKKKKNGGY